ncbi:MAG: 4Fe-4S binding protein [Planctomycetota bacterium]|jgi:polyferredoxin
MVAMANTGSKTTTSWLLRWRAGVQAAFLFVWLDPLMLRLHTVCGPVFHCYSCPLAAFACPIGVLANFGALHVFPFIAIGTLLLVGALVGSLLCGWACPFGYVQDLAGKVPTPKFELPRWSGYGRYAVLGGLVLAVPFLFGEGHALFICRVCPAGALEAALPNAVRLALNGEQVVWPSALKIGITVLFVAAIFFTWRPWCRVLCPLGGIYGLFNRGSAFFLRFHPERCTDCGRCRRPCRYGVTPGERANDHRCLRCLECTRCGAFSFGTVFGASPEPEPRAQD